MARKAIVDKERILELLKEGETTQRIAEEFGVSRQAIDLHRKGFISRGVLPDKRAARRRSSSSQSSGNGTGYVRAVSGNGTNSSTATVLRQPELIPQAKKRSPDSISLDDHIDMLISAFSALKRISVLEQELAVYKKENERISREIEKLKSVEQKRIEQENRWMLIQEDPPQDTDTHQQNSMF